jgi:hypothetical protein
MAKTLKDVPVITSISSQRLVTTDSSGVINSIAPANIANQIVGGIDKRFVMEDVGIVWHRSNNDPLICHVNDWAYRESVGDYADGVCFWTGTRFLVVAPTEVELPWASASVTGGGVMTVDRVTAQLDWEGKANTAAQITHEECASADYAPGYCAAYSRINSRGHGIAAGNWWLPSVGELFLMYAYRYKIQYALSFITGADVTLGKDKALWASTEYWSQNAWSVQMDGARLAVYNKSTDPHKVRPVSAIIR